MGRDSYKARCPCPDAQLILAAARVRKTSLAYSSEDVDHIPSALECSDVGRLLSKLVALMFLLSKDSPFIGIAPWCGDDAFALGRYSRQSLSWD